MARGRPSKKLEIAECAKSIFQKNGYQGTSIDQVVVLSGVSKPTVYSNFASKQILWVEVMKQVITASESAMQNLESHHEHFLDAWIEIWETWSHCDTRLSLYRIMLGEKVKMEAESLTLFSDFEAILFKKLDKLKTNQAPLMDSAHYAVLCFTSHYLFIDSVLYPNPEKITPDVRTLLSRVFS